MREASTSTSWANPDVEFERHVHAAIEMAYSDSRVTTQWMGLRVQILAAGLSNSIAQKLVQLTLPGIPDVYQGTEIIDDSLVDPDNRRLPDATRLAAAASSPALGHHPDPDQVKHWVVQHALALRRRRPQAFTSYTPVILQGPLREHLIGFDRGGAVTLATRLPQGLAAAGGWGEAALSLDGAWTNLLTGQTAAGRVRLADVFATLPVALLVQG